MIIQHCCNYTASSTGLLDSNVLYITLGASRMTSFPQMDELPPCMSTLGWRWHQIKRPGHPSDEFWLGRDADGNRWLTKLRGSFYAYREILFGRLAQAMNWSCQSSIYICLDPVSAETVGRPAGEIHAAHWFMDEHASQSCSNKCAMTPLFNQEIRTIEDLRPHEIKYFLDWPKSEFAAYIFGGNEPPGKLITTDHEFVIIDSEQMFSTNPCSFDTASWLKHADGSPSQSSLALAIEVCKEVSRLPSALVSDALAVPTGVEVEFRWPIEPKLRQSLEFATQYARLHPST